MRNYLQPGDILPLTAPAGGVVSGMPYLIGRLLVVATVTAAAGAIFEGVRVGYFTGLAKVSAQAWAVGEVLYWDPATSGFTNVGGAAVQRIGFAAAAAVNPSATGSVILTGNPAPLGA